MKDSLFRFITKSPTAFHAVKNITDWLDVCKFKRLYEGKAWDVKKGENYYVTRNDSSVIAFKVPENDIHGLMIAATHSDSPCFKIKDNPAFYDGNYTKLSVERYGGMINSTWLDRPLSVAGRVVYSDGDTVKSKLVDFIDPIAIIPSVAIHLNRNANENLTFNAATDLVPIINGSDNTEDFINSVANRIGVSVDSLLSSDLFLYNTEEGVEFGDFIAAPRLDDLQCVYASLDSFVASSNSVSMPVMAVFDNEEVGSGTKQGADSDFLNVVVTKLSAALGYSDSEVADIIANSFMLSCDNGHAVHPNHPELTDKNNSVSLNGGIVIKYNANQKYCTDAVSASLVKVLCKRAGVLYQGYANRSDIAGGSTLGNIANTHLSMITADIGLAQLAMHSSFETAGKDDTMSLCKLLDEFFTSTLEITEDNSYKI